MSAIDSSSFWALEAWRQQYSPVLWQPAHAEISVSKWGIPHPLQAGFVASFGEASGQNADFRLPLDDGREIHLREYDDHYTLHWDQVGAVKNPLGHLITDAPHWIIVGLLGLFIALLILGGQEEQ